MSDLKLKCNVVNLQYDYKDAPIDRMIMAVDTKTRKLVYAYLSNLGYTEKPFYTYLTSDRDIKIGDFFYNKLNREVYYADNQRDIDEIAMYKGRCVKVEASTDPKLHQAGVPIIPGTFIGKYTGKIFDVMQVDIEMELLLGNVEIRPATQGYGVEYINNYSVVTRPDKTVKLSKVDPKFTWEDMIKAFKNGRWSADPTFSGFGQTPDEYLLQDYDFHVPRT